MKGSRDVVLLEWSAENLPVLDHAKWATTIFLTIIIFATTGVGQVVVSALSVALAMVATGVLNLRQAFRAIDPKIITAIDTVLAIFPWSGEGDGIIVATVVFAANFSFALPLGYKIILIGDEGGALPHLKKIFWPCQSCLPTAN